MAKVVDVGAKNTVRRIDSVWMAVSVDPEDNTEGVCAWHDPIQGWLPLIAADEQRLPEVRRRARELAAATDKKIILIRLYSREIVEEFP